MRIQFVFQSGLENCSILTLLVLEILYLHLVRFALGIFALYLHGILQHNIENPVGYGIV